MSTKIVTLWSIKRAAQVDLRRALELRGSYLETYGIHNPWTGWLTGQDSPLAEKRSADICGWQGASKEAPCSSPSSSTP